MAGIRTLLFAGTAAAALAAGPAAANLIDFTAFPTGVGSHTVNLWGGITAKWDAYSSIPPGPGPTPGIFVKKTFNGWTGLGVDGMGDTEIDLVLDPSDREAIWGIFTTPVTIDEFTVAFLYDGPEFGDVEEVAQIVVLFGDLSVGVYYLTNSYEGPAGTAPATWTGTGHVTTLSPSTAADGAVFKVSNPFSGRTVKEIIFTVFPGTCGAGDCTNQSDYALVSMQVPEPATLALFGAGLLGLGYALRRRAA